jgi:hypothetical protein
MDAHARVPPPDGFTHIPSPSPAAATTQDITEDLNSTHSYDMATMTEAPIQSIFSSYTPTSYPTHTYSHQHDSPITSRIEEVKEVEEVHNTRQDRHSVHHDHKEITRIASTSKVADKAIAPFLARHIPAAYAPTGSKPEQSSLSDPSTKFCYRHRPDVKCRRTADEPSMDHLQRVCHIQSWR